jgi:hypothetical protein
MNNRNKEKRMEDKKDIWVKWFVFKNDLGKLYKNSSNPFYKSKYADLSAVLDLIQDKLLLAGLDVVFQFDSTEKDRVGIIPIIISNTGESITMGTLWMPSGVKNDPQDVGKAITYGRRFYLLSLVDLAQEDDDGDELSLDAKKKHLELIYNDIKEIKEATIEDIKSVYTKIISKYKDKEDQDKIVKAKDERRKELGI